MRRASNANGSSRAMALRWSASAHFVAAHRERRLSPLARLWLNARHLSRFSPALDAAARRAGRARPRAPDRDHRRRHRFGRLPDADVETACIRIFIAVDGSGSYVNSTAESDAPRASSTSSPTSPNGRSASSRGPCARRSTPKAERRSARRAGCRYSTSLPATETSRMSSAISAGIGGISSRTTPVAGDQTRLTCRAGSSLGVVAAVVAAAGLAPLERRFERGAGGQRGGLEVEGVREVLVAGDVGVHADVGHARLDRVELGEPGAQALLRRARRRRARSWCCGWRAAARARSRVRRPRAGRRSPRGPRPTAAADRVCAVERRRVRRRRPGRRCARRPAAR